jgi:hypothetical protein
LLTEGDKYAARGLYLDGFARFLRQTKLSDVEWRLKERGIFGLCDAKDFQ